MSPIERCLLVSIEHRVEVGPHVDVLTCSFDGVEIDAPLEGCEAYTEVGVPLDGDVADARVLLVFLRVVARHDDAEGIALTHGVGEPSHLLDVEAGDVEPTDRRSLA